MLAIVAAVIAALWTFVKPQSQQALCVVMIDLTASTSDQKAIEDYRQSAHQAVQTCDEIDAKFFVGEFSQSADELDFHGEEGTGFALYRDKWNPSIAGINADDAMHTIDETLELLVEGADPGTDVIGAIRKVGTFIEAQAAGDEVSDVRLLVLTDGAQRGGSFDMSPYSTTGDYDGLLLIVESAGYMPNLSGVSVTFAGTPGYQDDAQIDETAKVALEGFWESLVEQAQGNWCGYKAEPDEYMPAGC